MKNIFLFISVAFLATMLTAPVMARPITPIEAYPTWDLDMINIESGSETGAGVYVAVLDTGLAPNWRDYFPKERIATKLGIGFYEPCYADPKTGEIMESGKVHTTTFIGSTGACHGTHVISTIIGYYYRTPIDAAWGYLLPPIIVKGVAPDVTIIPVKVLADYSFPKWVDDPDMRGHDVVFGTDKMVTAGINYATDLAIEGYSPMIITMSLGGPDPSPMIEAAINNAISNGVVVVVAAGNSGTDGMDYPGAYSQVISVGACGWKYEWWWPLGYSDDEGDGPDNVYPDINYYYPGLDARNRLWWLQSPYNGWRDVAEDGGNEIYIANFSSRELTGQELDVVAPGSWVRGPYPGTPGYAHLPWWSQGWGSLVGWNPGNFYYAGGTSMSTPHVTGVAALMLQENPLLTQTGIETILKTTALGIPAGSMDIVDFIDPSIGWGWTTVAWGSDATGAGLIDAAAAALTAVP
jgi:subtilisin family serine protease